MRILLSLMGGSCNSCDTTKILQPPTQRINNDSFIISVVHFLFMLTLRSLSFQFKYFSLYGACDFADRDPCIENLISTKIRIEAPKQTLDMLEKSPFEFLHLHQRLNTSSKLYVNKQVLYTVRPTFQTPIILPLHTWPRWMIFFREVPAGQFER